MDAANIDEKSILEWEEETVAAWFGELGYPQYKENIIEHSITGDILAVMDADTLKSLGIATVGQRLHILKSVYMIKVAHNIAFEPDDYVPPSKAGGETLSVDKLNAIVQDQADRLRILEEENDIMSNTLQSFVDEFNSLKESLGRSVPDDGQALRRQPSFKWAQYASKSPTKADMDTPQPSPQQVEHDITPPATVRPPPPLIVQPPPPPPPSTSNGQRHPPNGHGQPPKPVRQESSDNLHRFKVSLDDPTHKVLPAALKKYKINNDNWEDYAMFICFGSQGNRIERCLSYDEKPLLLFQKLKDAKKNPVFMLKHIKDIRSPIVVAQQKHAARKASSIASGEGTVQASTKPARPTVTVRPPQLEVTAPQSNWPDIAIASPLVEHPQDGLVAPHSAVTQASPSLNGGGEHKAESSHSGREILPSSGVSYAVAIYPYMAEQDDEFDVVVGDTFIIVSRARGWWVVQRDPNGSGVMDTDVSKHGWVPAGCLLETNVPVASAIAEARSTTGGNVTGASKMPILPLSIISTSFPGIALMEYKRKGEEELDLYTNDLLRVFKRYNHWSYAVKEDGGDRGWVPSWFIGKVSPANAGTPPTPSQPSMAVNQSLTLEDTSGQPSPMSSAFPARMS
ncbi:hypothetical protein CYLTODRAFT_430557 [Cylindrobasidium torrendii FP15055 ss-10]|uniref:RA-domain-containing protein n=1 Tax=Cylindrobasidium torrendii FP15055 ss-10 TaxID=1314674 RepID=A0A0D7BFF0_9AGAR|nr:hypothetical protein CYLTODRAFT_430557 [Cylindrobasidium torrendii FP15055 ss-10]